MISVPKELHLITTKLIANIKSLSSITELQYDLQFIKEARLTANTTTQLVRIVAEYSSLNPQLEIARELLEYSNDLRNLVVNYIKYKKDSLTHKNDENLREIAQETFLKVVLSIKHVYQAIRMIEMRENQLAELFQVRAEEISPHAVKIMKKLRELLDRIHQSDFQYLKDSLRDLLIELKEAQAICDEFNLFGDIPIDLQQEYLELCRAVTAVIKDPTQYDQFTRQKNQMDIIFRSLIMRCREAGVMDDFSGDTESEFSLESDISDEEQHEGYQPNYQYTPTLSLSTFTSGDNIDTSLITTTLPLAPALDSSDESPRRIAAAAILENNSNNISNPNFRGNSNNTSTGNYFGNEKKNLGDESLSSDSSFKLNIESAPMPHYKPAPHKTSQTKIVPESAPIYDNPSNPPPHLGSNSSDSISIEVSQTPHLPEKATSIKDKNPKPIKKARTSRKRRSPSKNVKDKNFVMKNKTEDDVTNQSEEEENSQSETTTIPILKKNYPFSKSIPSTISEESSTNQEDQSVEKDSPITSPSSTHVIDHSLRFKQSQPAQIQPMTPHIIKEDKYKTTARGGSNDDAMRRDSKQFFGSLKTKSNKKDNRVILVQKKTSKENRASTLFSESSAAVNGPLVMNKEVPQKEIIEKILNVFSKEMPGFKENWNTLPEEQRPKILESLNIVIDQYTIETRLNTKGSKRKQNEFIDDDFLSLINSQNTGDLANILSNTKTKSQKNTFGFRPKSVLRTVRIDRKDFLNVTCLFPIVKISDISTDFVKHSVSFFLHLEDFFKVSHKKSLLHRFKDSSLEKPPKQNKQHHDHSQKTSHLIQNLYTTLKQLYAVLLEALELIKNSPSLVLLPEGNPIRKTYQRAYDQVSKYSEKETTMEIDMDIYLTGRYSCLIQNNLLINLNRKTTAFGKAIIQLISELGKITAVASDISDSNFLHFFGSINSISKIVIGTMRTIETLFYLVSLPNKKKKKKHTHSESSEKDHNKEEIIPTSEKIDAPGDLTDLVMRLVPPIDHAVNTDYLNSFIMTCRRFCTAEDLLNCLFDRFHKSKKKHEKDHSESDISKRNVVCLRVINAMHKWMKTNNFLIDKRIAHLIYDFIEKNVIKEKTFEILGGTLINELKRTDLFELPAELIRAPYDLIPKWINSYPPYDITVQNDEVVLAKQLTTIEWEIFLRITDVELQGQAWNKDKTACLAQNVVELIQRSNHVSFWVATCILVHESPKHQARMITSFISIAKALRDMNNYNTLMSIIVGLNSSPITRLKSAFAMVKKSSIELFEELMELMNPTNSFKKYRAALEESEKTALPYIGMSLSNLTFMEDGNVDEIPSAESSSVMLINFPKHYMIYKTIVRIQQYQQTSEWIIETEESLLNYLSELPVLREHELYELSLLREPRVAT